MKKKVTMKKTKMTGTTATKETEQESATKKKKKRNKPTTIFHSFMLNVFQTDTPDF